MLSTGGLNQPEWSPCTVIEKPHLKGCQNSVDFKLSLVTFQGHPRRQRRRRRRGRQRGGERRDPGGDAAVPERAQGRLGAQPRAAQEAAQGGQGGDGEQPSR